MLALFQCEICGVLFERERSRGGRPAKACDLHIKTRATRRTAEWQKANPERTKINRAKTWAKYYAAHREELIAKQVERQRDDPRKRARDLARYARTRGATESELFTLDEIYLRDGGVCHLCEKDVDRSQATVDHLIPVSLGGPHTRANVALAHHSCNSSRNTMPVDEWRAKKLEIA